MATWPKHLSPLTDSEMEILDAADPRIQQKGEAGAPRKSPGLSAKHKHEAEMERKKEKKKEVEGGIVSLSGTTVRRGGGSPHPHRDRVSSFGVIKKTPTLKSRGSSRAKS